MASVYKEVLKIDKKNLNHNRRKNKEYEQAIHKRREWPIRIKKSNFISNQRNMS